MPQYQHLDQTQFQCQQLPMYHIRDPASSDAFATPLDPFDPFQASATLPAQSVILWWNVQALYKKTATFSDRNRFSPPQ